MGTYLNPGAKALQQGRNSQIYVDKFELISYLNLVLDTERRFVCVSRPRRFGKTMAANMVCAYYDRTVFNHRQLQERGADSCRANGRASGGDCRRADSRRARRGS